MLGEGGWGDRLVFPAPRPSYDATSFQKHLCWIPWNDVISPERAADEMWSDGIPCLWFSAQRAAGVILFFHANAEDLGMCFHLLRHVRDQFKVNVLAVEYPGYGLLKDMAPTESAVHEISLTVFRYLVDEVGVRYSQITLFGRSLGSGPAVYLAAQYPVGGLILVSAFTSIRAAVSSIIGRPFAWAFTERFPNAKLISNVSCSTLFIHGENDGLIPPEQSLKLFKNCRARKLLVTPAAMDHNTNLFKQAEFFAVPAIHFFGFPGFYTLSPPRLPRCLFDPTRSRLNSHQMSRKGFWQAPWMCDCISNPGNMHTVAVVHRAKDCAEDIEAATLAEKGDNFNGVIRTPGQLPAADEEETIERSRCLAEGADATTCSASAGPGAREGIASGAQRQAGASAQRAEVSVASMPPGMVSNSAADAKRAEEGTHVVVQAPMASASASAAHDLANNQPREPDRSEQPERQGPDAVAHASEVLLQAPGLPMQRAQTPMADSPEHSLADSLASGEASEVVAQVPMPVPPTLALALAAVGVALKTPGQSEQAAQPEQPVRTEVAGDRPVAAAHGAEAEEDCSFFDSEASGSSTDSQASADVFPRTAAACAALVHTGAFPEEVSPPDGEASAAAATMALGPMAIAAESAPAGARSAMSAEGASDGVEAPECASGAGAAAVDAPAGAINAGATTAFVAEATANEWVGYAVV